MKDRIVSLDLLRCMAMVMIVCLHIIGQGGIAQNMPNGVGKQILLIFHYFCDCSVNLFLLLSGYVGVKHSFNYTRIVRLYLQTLFWSFLLHYIYISCGKTGLNFFHYIPLFTKYYWFFTSYFCLFMAMPAINHVIETMPLEKIKKLLFIFFILFCILPCCSIFGYHSFTGGKALMLNNGYSPLWLGYVYLIGGCISKYGINNLLNINLRKRYCVILMVVLSLMGSYLTYHELSFWGRNLKLYFSFASLNYNSPFIIFIAIVVFEFFRQIKLTIWSSFFSFFAKYSFGVFLIHTQYDIYECVLKNRFVWIVSYPCVTIFLVVLSAVSIFIIASLMDWVRDLIFSLTGINSILVKNKNRK